jgi:hypothetical protein
MAYDGEHVYQCNRYWYPWHRTYAVIVSGAKWNACGHAILNLGGPGGDYFHIAGKFRVRPWHMAQAGYERYLFEQEKREIVRQYIPINKPALAQAKLEELTATTWIWGVLPHNCASFVEEIIQAGGSDAGLYLNCPTLEKW